MKNTILGVLLFSSLLSFGQAREVAETIENLRTTWDSEASLLQTYEGLGRFCGVSTYRKHIIGTLDEIHHYDTLLYFIVSRKFDEKKNKEARATQEDIENVEATYTTYAFKQFIHQECNTYNEIERNYGKAKGATYHKEVHALEKELKKYVTEIMKRVDLIDEHVHHLHLSDD